MRITNDNSEYRSAMVREQQVKSNAHADGFADKLVHVPWDDGARAVVVENDKITVYEEPEDKPFPDLITVQMYGRQLMDHPEYAQMPIILRSGGKNFEVHTPIVAIDLGIEAEE